MPYLSWKSFDYKGDAFSVFEAIKDRANPFFLDSSLRKYGLGRYSFLGCEPFYVFKGQGPAALEKLRRLLERYKFKTPKTDFPFVGGAVGYFSYDWGLSLEGIESRKKADLPLPEVFMGLYDVVIALDHWEKKLAVFSSGFPERSAFAAKKRAKERLRQVVGLLPEARTHIGRMIPVGRPPCLPAGRHRAAPASNFTKEGYLKAVTKAKEYIRKGDIYQVNLSQRFSAQSPVSPGELYASLRRESPGNFSAYLDCGDFQILSSSPERFLCLDGKKVFTRPMKGTRPRGKDAEDDTRQKNNLLKSAKDKAELMMITDLMRNDLGRVCEYGSVKVTQQKVLETYPTLHHLVAPVKGELDKKYDLVDVIKATFPGGSITGAPKIRAMEIIDELEPTRRNAYTGAIGYIGFDGTMDLSIAIRIIMLNGNKAYYQVGGGIVADSDPASEYEETLTKGKALLKACLI